MNGQPDPSRRGNRDWPSITPADGVSPINRVYRDEVTKPADTVGRFPKAESASRAVLTCQTVSNPTVGTITLFDGRLIKIDGTTGGTYQAASSLETVVRVNGLSASQIAAEIAEAVTAYHPDLCAGTSGAKVGIYKSSGDNGITSNDLSWAAGTETISILRPNLPAECIVGCYHPQHSALKLVSCRLVSSNDSHSTFAREWQIDMERLGELVPGLNIDAALRVGSLTSRQREAGSIPPREFLPWVQFETVTSEARPDDEPDTDADSSSITPRNIAASRKQTTRPTWGTPFAKTAERFDPDTGEIRESIREVVAAGTNGEGIDAYGRVKTVMQVDDNWAIRTTEDAMGLAGNAAGTGTASRTRTYRDNWSWPRVLDYIKIWPMHSDPNDIFSPVQSYGWRPIWLKNAFNGLCNITLVERWTKKRPVVGGDAGWIIGPAWATATNYNAGDFRTHGGETYICLSSHTSGTFSTDLAAGKWRISSPELLQETPLFPQEIEFYGYELPAVRIPECLSFSQVIFDSSGNAIFPATVPPRWPETILGRVLVDPDQGGWLTRYFYIDSPDPTGRSTGVDLVQVDGGATWFKLSWSPGGGTTKLDVSTDPTFQGGWLAGFHDLTVSSSAPFEVTVTGAQRGRIYYARIRRTTAGLTSNTCVCMAKPVPELTVSSSGNALVSAGNLVVADAPVGGFSTVTLSLANIGLETLRDLAASLSGTDFAMFELGELGDSLDPGASTPLVITFRPTSFGSKTATLTIASNDASTPFTLTLNATGTAPEITLEQPAGTNINTGASLSFGSVTSGSITKVFKLRNTGNAPLRDLALSISGTNSGDWTISSDLSSTEIAGGGYLNFSLTFDPIESADAYGSRAAVLSITSNDGDENPFVLNLTGVSSSTTSPGAVDWTFDRPCNGVVRAIAIQADGKIIVGGEFTTVDGSTRNRIARINTDGTLDTGFNPGADGTVLALAVQDDGKIIVGGAFANIASTARNRIARLNADGTIDASYNPDAGGEVRCLLLDSAGDCYVGGNFATIAGGANDYLVRLNSDGTLDGGFTAPTDINAAVNAIAFDSSGKIVVVGEWAAAPSSSVPP